MIFSLPFLIQGLLAKEKNMGLLIHVICSFKDRKKLKAKKITFVHCHGQGRGFPLQVKVALIFQL